MWSRKHVVVLLALPGLVAACYGGAGVDESGSGDEVTQEAQAALTCSEICQNEFTACMHGCFGVPDNPDLPSNPCDDSCIQEKTYCLDSYSNFTFAQNGNTVCHLDIDTYWNGVDIEFYTVDVWRDQGCAQQPDRYRKRYLGKVSCSHWTGLTNQSECGRRIETKLGELAGQGYIPTFTQADVDQCPLPRI